MSTLCRWPGAKVALVAALLKGEPAASEPACRLSLPRVATERYILGVGLTPSMSLDCVVELCVV